MTFGSPKKTDQSPVSDQASARAFAGADLLASPLPSRSASSFRAREAGTTAFMMRFSRPGTILERFLRRPLRPSDTHCSTLIALNGQSVSYQAYHTPVPKILQWNFELQQELNDTTVAKLAYVASHGYNLLFPVDINQVPEQ
jgi:hypothetical protein